MAGKLSALAIKNAKVGKYADGNNLYLVVQKSRSKKSLKATAALTKKWVFRFSWRGRAQEMGMGSAVSVSATDARAAAVLALRQIAQDINPIDARKRQAGIMSFEALADEVIDSVTQGHRNRKSKPQWKASLRRHAAPLQAMPVNAITTEHILRALEPAWTTVPVTAERVRARIEKVLDAATARGLREGENPARWKGNLGHLLPKQQKLLRGHHKSLPYTEVGTFISRLRNRGGKSALALEFCILTAARTSEVLEAPWSEIDLENKLWTVPAWRMKPGREHRVPLSQAALRVLQTMLAIRANDFIFPGQGKSGHLADMSSVLRRMGAGVTVHGFRSSFRDWAGNETNHSREVIEMSLSHVVGGAVEQAYRRSDALEKRRALLDDWADYCEL